MINTMDRKGFLRRAKQWLTPGMHIKRWFVLILLGITMLAVGAAMYLLDVYRTAPDTWWLPLLSLAALRFLPRIWRVIIFGSLGVALVVWGISGLNRSLLAPFLQPGSQILDELMAYYRRKRGPRVVAIGGGHGLSTLLRGLKAYTGHLTAVVTVADDGGSSGRLRDSLGILPPGDIRNCLAALSNDEALLTQLFQYRFGGDLEGLEGHSFGNLFISALSAITGSFEEAIAESGRVLSVQGRVLPATLHNVRLIADVINPTTNQSMQVRGESRIPQAAGYIRRVWLEPPDAPAFPPVVQALLSADIIVVGPGSLYTSILPNLLVRDLLAALQTSTALKIFVCNTVTQPGETDGYTCYDHARALEAHFGDEIFDLILCNQNYEGTLPDGIDWVQDDARAQRDSRVRCLDLADHQRPGAHDAARLAAAILQLYQDWQGMAAW